MDILTFTVGDMRVALPFDRLAIGASLLDAKTSLEKSGGGTLNVTIDVVDLRRKFEFPEQPGEQETRLIMIEVDHRPIGLIINVSSGVTILRDVEIDTASVPRHPHILGVVIEQGEPAFLFDWDALLTSNTTTNLDDLFRVPVLEDPRPAAAKFLDQISQHPTLDDQHIRQMAESFGLPLSVANRLITFYTSNL